MIGHWSWTSNNVKPICRFAETHRRLTHLYRNTLIFRVILIYLSSYKIVALVDKASSFRLILSIVLGHFPSSSLKKCWGAALQRDEVRFALYYKNLFDGFYGRESRDGLKNSCCSFNVMREQRHIHGSLTLRKLFYKGNGIKFAIWKGIE